MEVGQTKKRVIAEYGKSAEKLSSAWHYIKEKAGFQEETFFRRRKTLALCIAQRYNCFVLRSFQHDALRNFFENGSTRGLDAQLAKRLRVRLDVMNVASELSEIAAQGWNLHPLKGDREGVWSLWVNASWRLTFRFQEGDCFDVNLERYH